MSRAGSRRVESRTHGRVRLGLWKCALNMSTDEEAIAVVRRNAEEVQGRGDFEVFDQLFATDFVDHTPQRGFGADREAVRALYRAIRTSFPDFFPEIHFQVADGGMVTTY